MSQWTIPREARKPISSATNRHTTRLLAPDEIRIQRDMADLDLPPRTAKLVQPDSQDWHNLFGLISPDEGYYRGGHFQFSLSFKPGTYPYEPPRIYHPNIDTEGNVCLNILREDWKPVLSLNAIMYGLLSLFLEPTPEDPLMKDVAMVLRTNRHLFADNVRKSMRGAVIGTIEYDFVFKEL